MGRMVCSSIFKPFSTDIFSALLKREPPESASRAGQGNSTTTSKTQFCEPTQEPEEGSSEAKASDHAGWKLQWTP